ncbi:MAG: aldo/keto reductase, partial [Thermoplasmata archaeon]
FSSHISTNEFKNIIDDYTWDFCQIQYNYLDEKNQAGTDGLKYASSKGLAVMIMEPLRGGALAKAPNEVKKIFDESEYKRTPAEWAFRWLWNHPEVTVVLSGMNEESHIEENIKTASTSKPNSMSNEELEIVNSARDTYRKLMKVSCTGCRYCVPCPFGVNIPRCFELYNGKYLGTGLASGNPTIEYIINVGDVFSGTKPGYASQCKNCNRCVKKCPQHLPIPKHLSEVKNEFEGFTFPIMKFVVKNYLKFDRWRNMRKGIKN